MIPFSSILKVRAPVIKLLPTTPFSGLLPKSAGALNFAEVRLDQLFAVAPHRGQSKAVSSALQTQIGLGLSAKGRASSNGRARVIWCGHRVWLVGAEIQLDGMAAVTDQSDAWAILRVDGLGVEDMLARLVPIDLRPHVFKGGHTARTLVGHMPAVITRVGKSAFEIMVMRSMAGTLLHDIDRVTATLFCENS